MGIVEYLCTSHEYHCNPCATYLYINYVAQISSYSRCYVYMHCVVIVYNSKAAVVIVITRNNDNNCFSSDYYYDQHYYKDTGYCAIVYCTLVSYCVV